MTMDESSEELEGDYEGDVRRGYGGADATDTHRTRGLIRWQLAVGSSGGCLRKTLLKLGGWSIMYIIIKQVGLALASLSAAR